MVVAKPGHGIPREGLGKVELFWSTELVWSLRRGGPLSPHAGRVQRRRLAAGRAGRVGGRLGQGHRRGRPAGDDLATARQRLTTRGAVVLPPGSAGRSAEGLTCGGGSGRAWPTLGTVKPVPAADGVPGPCVPTSGTTAACGSLSEPAAGAGTTTSSCDGALESSVASLTARTYRPSAVEAGAGRSRSARLVPRQSSVAG